MYLAYPAYLSLVSRAASPSPLVSSVTVAKEQLSFLRLCLGLAVSAGCSVSVPMSWSEQVWPLVGTWSEVPCPFNCVCWWGVFPSVGSDAGVSRLGLEKVLLIIDFTLLREHNLSPPSSPLSSTVKDAKTFKCRFRCGAYLVKNKQDSNKRTVTINIFL